MNHNRISNLQFFLSPFENSRPEILSQESIGSSLGTVDKDQREKSTAKSVFKALFTSRKLLSLIMTLSNTVIYFMIWSALPGGSWIIYCLRLKRYFYAWALYWEDENSIPFFKGFKKFWTIHNKVNWGKIIGLVFPRQMWVWRNIRT